jgi:hypothetical protein
MSKFPCPLRCLLCLSFSLSLSIAVWAAALETPVLTGTTPEGIRIQVFSELNPLAINQIHSWHIRVLNADGTRLQPELSISGGMPEHNHGLPTAPQITGTLDNGDYLLEGMRFHMPGHWQLRFDLSVDDTEQTAVIDFTL